MIAAGANFVFLYDMPAGPSPSPSHWGFTSNQNGKTYSYPRGTGLGGSTNHHAQVDGRGSPRIWDQIAEEVGDEIWSYQRLLPLFMKMENFNIPYVDERVHGRNGWLHVKRANLEKGFHPEQVNVAIQDFGMPFRHDFYNDPANYAGVGWTDIQMHPDGRRSNAAVDCRCGYGRHRPLARARAGGHDADLPTRGSRAEGAGHRKDHAGAHPPWALPPH